MNPFTEYYMRTCLWPAVVFVILLLIIGVFGNILILYIYRHHFHRSTPWLFIYVLAILDILACVISMPLELVILGTYTDFPSGNLCKFSRYITFILHGSSCVILMAIAFNRYEKVCRPRNQFLNLRRAKKLCIGTILFAAITMLPSLSIYGEVNFLLQLTPDGVVYSLPGNRGNLTSLADEDYPTTIARFCHMPSTKANVILGPLFYIFQFILYVILVALVIYFYSRIIYTMVEYSSKQKALLLQMASSVSRVDHVREVKAKDTPKSVTNDDQTADFSKDFCRNEVSVDWEKTETNGLEKESSNNTNPGGKKDSSFRSSDFRNQISPPLICHDADGKILKSAESDNNIHIHRLNSVSSDPLETNKLLMRRIKSTENFTQMSLRIPQLHVASIDPFEAMFEPLFLHAPKMHKKKDSIQKGTFSLRKSLRLKSKPVTRSKSNVDVSMRVDLPSNRKEKGGLVSCRSLEGLANMHLGNAQPTAVNTSGDGSLTLTRRSAKGNKNCVIHLTGLSMKSAMNYDTPDSSEKPADESNDTADKSVENPDETAIDNDINENKVEKEKEEAGDVETDKPRDRTNTVTFKTEENEDKPADNMSYLSVQKREVRKVSSDETSRNSENILSPQTRTVEYRRRQSVQPIRAQRTSRMLFWISLAFVLSFLPFWIIVFLRTMKGEEDRPSNLVMAFMQVLVRFTHISNAINPVIYGLMNTQFRNRCSDIFKWSSFKEKFTRVR